MYRPIYAHHRVQHAEPWSWLTCSAFPFLAEFFPLVPPTLDAARGELCTLLAGLLLRFALTDVMMVGWTIHWKSGVVAIAVTVGIKESDCVSMSWQSS